MSLSHGRAILDASESSDTSIDISLLVNDKWKIESRIGSGAAGIVYAAKDVDSGETMAVKIEHRDKGNGLLRNERDIYEHLGCFRESIRGLPFIHFFGEYGPDHEALVMDFLGPSLETDIKSGQIKDQETISRIATEALDILQYVHCQGIVHMDIIAENLLRSRNDTDTLHLVDFGNSEKYRERGEKFEKLQLLDLKDLGEILYQLRRGKEYMGEPFSCGIVPELDQYFGMLQSNHVTIAIDYTPLQELFEA